MYRNGIAWTDDPRARVQDIGDGALSHGGERFRRVRRTLLRTWPARIDGCDADGCAVQQINRTEESR
jgi:hypothetical protein